MGFTRKCITPTQDYLIKNIFMEKNNKQVLFCDLDGTLIKTVSGKTFPVDVFDFQIRKDVLDKIRERRFAEVVIVTNQGGIPEYVTEHDFVAKLKCIETFIKRYTGAVAYSLYCPSADKNHPDRKPNTGMLNKAWACFLTGYDKRQMVMVGDASGKPGDFSDSDKKCAENFGIDYIDVEDFIKEGV